MSAAAPLQVRPAVPGRCWRSVGWHGACGSRPRLTGLGLTAPAGMLGNPRWGRSRRHQNEDAIPSQPPILSPLTAGKPGPPWPPFGSPLFRSSVGDLMKMERATALGPRALGRESYVSGHHPLAWLLVPTQSYDIRLAGRHGRPWA